MFWTVCFGIWYWNYDPRIVASHGGGSGTIPGSHTGLVDETLHEYQAGSSSITTGRSITFRFPAEFFTVTDDLIGGAQSSVYLVYDIDTRKPLEAPPDISPWRTREQNRAARAPWQKRYDGTKHVSVDILNRDVRTQPRTYTREQLLRHHGHEQKFVQTVLGYEQFELVKPPWNYNDQPPPFDRGWLFARRNAAGVYDVVIECTRHVYIDRTLRPGFPKCARETLFEGLWRLRVQTSGKYLDRFDDSVEQAKQVLTNHIIERTPVKYEPKKEKH